MTGPISTDAQIDSPADRLREVERLYELSRYGDAHLAAASLGEPRAWPDTEGRVLAARMAYRLGAPRLAQGLIFDAYRRAPHHADAIYYYTTLVYRRRGPWHALRWLRGAEPRDPSREMRALLLGLEGRALGELRDFERAHARLDAAEELETSSPYLPCERAFVLEREDRMADALAAAQLALERRPGYRPALLELAHLHAAAGDPERAIAVLEVEHADQSWEILAQRAELAFGLGRYEDCLRDLEASVRAARWMDRDVERHLAARRAECAYLLRRYREAAALARASETDFGTKFAEALDGLTDGDPPPRVELSAVPHVRQHHVTCAPASMASVAAYFGRPVDQLELAEEICYGGTPDHLQRVWGEREGWLVRQLDVTSFETIRALVDRGIPILLATAAVTSSHLQVVIGYDLARRSMLIRDPSVPHLVELPVDELLAAQAWYGPPGKLLLPKERAGDLEGIELPAASLHDHRFALVSAMDRHDEATMAAELDALEREAPEHRLTIQSRLAVLGYRGDVDGQLACYERLLELYPLTASFVLHRGELMRGRRSRAEQLAYWRRYAHLDHPPLLSALAEELRHEGAHQEEAARLLRRALRINPLDGFPHHVLGDLEASRGAPPEVTLESFRFAVCLTEHDEHFARAYYQEAREHGMEEEALRLLERRVERAGARSSGPAKTLFAVHRDRGNVERGVEVLERLALARPEDGELALEIVHAHLDAGDVGAAQRALDAARALRARPVDRKVALARLARLRGRLDEARAHLEEAVTEAPRRLDAVFDLIDLVRELDGPEAALARLERAIEAAPDERPLIHERCAALRGVDDRRVIELLNEQLRAHPDDQWARRELALRHAALGELEQGLEVARQAIEYLPHDSWAHGILGRLLAFAGRREEARAALRRAIELDVDNAGAMQSLHEADGPAELREDARFVLDLLVERVSHGAGLQEAAFLSRCLSHEERIERLRRLVERVPRRPDGWEAVVHACMDADDLDEAERLVEEAIARFPRWVSLHVLAADVARLRGDAEEHEACLRRAIERAPAWPDPAAKLARVLRERGDDGGALALVDDALTRMPRAIALRLERATILWSRGDRAEAFEQLLAAVSGALGDDAAFRRLWSWAGELGRDADVEALVREHVAKNEASSLGPYRLALLLDAPDRLEERLEAAREALRRNPRHAEAADLLAEALARAGRFEEALAACPPPEWRGTVPTTIRGRHAWVLAESGRMDEAIAEMGTVLAADPSYGWGRRNLCDWLDSRGDAEGFLKHARQLVEHEPLAGPNHVYLADALTATGDEAGARDAFARAIELSPEHAYATTRFVELDLSRGGDPIDALARARHVLPAATYESLCVRVHTMRDRDDEALASLDRLLDTRARQAELERALEALASGPRGEEALAAVEARFTDPDPPAGAALGLAWSNVRERMGRGRGALRILKVRDRLGPAGLEAAARWVEVLATQRRWLPLAWLAVRHLAWLRRHDATWGSVGYALSVLRFYRWCARWLSDFAQRSGAQAWMLLNLVFALWIVRGGRGARDVVEHALALPSDHASHRHRFWLAFEQARAGSLEAAREQLALGGPASAGSVEAGLASLVAAFEASARLGVGADTDARVEAVRDPLLDAARAASQCPELRAPYDAAVRVLFADLGWLSYQWVRLYRLPRPVT